MTRRIRLNNDPVMREDIIQGLRPEIKRVVLDQRPTTLEALAKAAAIGEAHARTSPTVAKTTYAAVTAQQAEMRAMMATLQDVVIAGQRQHAGVYILDARTAVPEHLAATTTTILTAATPTTTPSDPRNVTNVTWLAAWRSGNGVGRINKVTLRRARLVLGWVTCPGSTPGGGTLFRYVTSQPGPLSVSYFRGR